MATVEHSSPRTKVPGTWRPPGQGPHPDLEVRLGYALKHAEAHTSWKHQVHLREVRLTEVEDGWRLMFKGDHDGKPVVAYAYDDTYIDALIQGLTTLDLGRCVWSPDDYPPKRYAKPTVPLRF